MVSIVNITPTKIRIQVARESNWHQFEIEQDKSKLAAPMNGRLVRWLVPDKTVVVPQQRVCEIEAMKMITVVTAKTAGYLSYKVQEGVSFIEGDILASLEQVVSGSIAAPVLASQQSNSHTPIGVPGVSVVGGLISLLSDDSLTQDATEDFMDGFTGVELDKNSILNLSSSRIDGILSNFLTDEVCALKIVHDHQYDGDMAVLLGELTEVSDSDLLAAWRHRTTLRERAAIVRDLVLSPSFSNIDLATSLIQSLD